MSGGFRPDISETVRKRCAELFTLYRGKYSDAYRFLAAAEKLKPDFDTSGVYRTLSRRGAIIASQELTQGGSGNESVRFLGAITCVGELTLWETVGAQCGRVYELHDSYGISHILIEELRRHAHAMKLDTVCCMSPLSPKKIEHLLIPSLDLAFITTKAGQNTELKPCRRLRLDSAVDMRLGVSEKKKLRTSERIIRELTAETVACLAEAKALHDELERLLRPLTDFSIAEQAGEKITAELCSML